MALAGTMERMGRPVLPDPLRTSLVGRSRELEELRGRFAMALGGEPQVVLISGEAGIGKSRLVAEFDLAVGAEARLVVGQCLELGADGPPFAPFLIVLRGLVADLGMDRVAQLAGPGRPDLAILVPELGPSTLDESVGRGLLFDTMATLIQRGAGKRPLVLVVEDLHWSDTTTRDLLRFLLGTLGAARVLVLLTYRRDELHRGHPLLPWLAEVGRLPISSRLTLERLTDTQIDTMVTQLVGEVPPQVAARIRERSQGIPFLVEELTECADRDSARIPESLRDLMLARLERVSPVTRQVLEVASVGGTQVDHRVLLAAVGLDELVLEGTLREAVEGQVLVVDRDREGYAFRHALMREAVNDDLLPGEHARLHARYAAALEGLARPEQAGEIAHHWGLAHEVGKQFDWSIRAAEHAESVYAWREQLTHLEQALDLWTQVDDPQGRAGGDRATLLEQAARAAYHLNLTGRSLVLLDTALALIDPGVDPDRAAHLMIMRIVYGEEAPDHGLAAVETALGLAGATSLERADALALKVGALALTSNLDASISVAQDALNTAQAAGDARALSDTHQLLGCILLQLGHPEGVEHLQIARDVAVHAHEWSALMRYYVNYTDFLIGCGRFTECVAMAREGRAAAVERGRTRTYGAVLTINEAEAQLRAGDWDDTLATIEVGLGMAPLPEVRSVLDLLRATVQVRRGQVQAASDSAALATQGAGALAGCHQRSLPQAVVEAELAVARHDPTTALALLSQAAEASGTMVMPSTGWPFAWAVARILDDALDAQTPPRASPAAPPDPIPAGLRERTQTMLVNLVDHLQEVSDHPGWHALLRTLLASVAAPPQFDSAAPEPSDLGTGGPVPTQRDWAAAVTAVAAGEGLRYELAHARIRWAQQLLGNNDRDTARHQLHTAILAIDTLKAEPLRPLAQRVAAAGRISLRPPTRDTALLTAREREVLHLVAAGKTNKAIADELFISAKTASVHVSNILAKVGATTRTEAAAWAHEHPPAAHVTLTLGEASDPRSHRPGQPGAAR